jgi:predicted transcriptional regulator
MSYAEENGYDIGEGDWSKSSVKELRENLWITKEGEKIMIKNLDNRHLFNAYMKSGNETLFKEMVIRLFEKQ